MEPEERWRDFPNAVAILENLDDWERQAHEQMEAYDNEGDEPGSSAALEFKIFVALVRRGLESGDSLLLTDDDFTGVRKDFTDALGFLPTHSANANFRTTMTRLRKNIRPLILLNKKDGSGDERSFDLIGHAIVRSDEAAVDAEQNAAKAEQAVESIYELLGSIADVETNASTSAEKLRDLTREQRSQLEDFREELVAEASRAGLSGQQAHLEALNEQFRQYQAQAEEDLRAIRNRRNLAADAVLSGGYESEAEDEFDRAATSGRNGAIWSFVGAVLALLAALMTVGIAIEVLPGVESANLDLDWQAQLTITLSKFAVVGIVFGIANHHYRQARQHRNEGRRLRKLRLELETIGEYLIDMDPESKARVRGVLTPRFFSDPMFEEIDDDTVSLVTPLNPEGLKGVTGILKDD